tara:strand:+ start:18017 stop:18316 length:300 start_codon:yes stop_codon:yes gene_type:complete
MGGGVCGQGLACPLRSNPALPSLSASKGNAMQPTLAEPSAPSMGDDDTCDDAGAGCVSCGNTNRASLVAVRMKGPGGSKRQSMYCGKCGQHWTRHYVAR